MRPLSAAVGSIGPREPAAPASGRALADDGREPQSCG